jgi:hypothetical protein
VTATEIPFDRLAHAIRIPVTVADEIPARFLLDTGIGVTLVSKALAQRLGVRVSGEMKGKRMSGQELTVPLARVPSLTLGDRREDDVEVGVFDLAGMPPPLSTIDGILSLRHFERSPFTIDYLRERLVLETPETLADRRARGAAIPLTLDREAHALTAFTTMEVGLPRPVVLEVDTGSGGLILHSRSMAALGISPEEPTVKTLRGVDETGNDFVRHFARMRAPVFPPGAPEMRADDLPVAFQEIIHDGLIGDAYFRRFVVTYDLPRSEMILARP